MKTSNNADEKWLEKVEDVERYVLAGKPKRRTVRETAAHFGYSIGWVCEQLQLSRLIRLYPEYKELESRQEALNKLKAKKAKRLW